MTDSPIEPAANADDADDATVVQPGARHTEGAAPRRIAHYLLEQELGRGGQGLVFLARDSKLNRRVALKVLSTAMSFRPEARERFEREAEIASRLDHPGLCTVHEIGDDCGVAYIAMQYVEGRPLANLIREARQGGDASALELGIGGAGGEPTVDDGTSATSRRRHFAPVLELVEGVARALHQAHESGLVHRDVKPGNIMVTPNGRGVVLDFGLASAEDMGRDLTRTGHVMGTPTYMPPEQLRGEWSRVDRRADVYALGVTLYECLTLERPFEGPTIESLATAVARDPLPDPRRRNPRISRDLKVVLETAMEKDPDRRYATAADLADELRRVRTYQPVRARPAGVGLRVTRWVQRNPIVAASLGVIFLTMATALVAVTAALGSKTRALEEKAAAVHDYEGMADVKRASQAENEAAALWPARPRMRAAMRDWLRRYRPLTERLEPHRAALATVRAEIARGDGGDLAAWKEEVLGELVRSLERLADPADGVVGDVERRLASIDAIEAATTVAHADAWQAAVAAVAADERYRGLVLRPVPGLIPLGADPTSGLQEFLDHESHDGPLPERDENGRVVVGESTGVVLVLVPAGTFVMGRSRDPESEWYEERAEEDEGPPHEVTLDAFLMSKYELTRGQWKRLAGGEDPSYWTRERAKSFVDERIDVLPVENVSWNACMALFARFELTLPTEAQWEYAARAGTTTLFAFGDDVTHLEVHENTADTTFGKIAGGRFHAEADDGYGLVAPVGSFAANPWGLHDVHGNVGEWCLCAYGSLALPVQPGTGERIVVDAGDRVLRGGHYAFDGRLARLSSRTQLAPGYTVNIDGVRPAMRLPRE